MFQVFVCPGYSEKAEVSNRGRRLLKLLSKVICVRAQRFSVKEKIVVWRGLRIAANAVFFTAAVNSSNTVVACIPPVETSVFLMPLDL